MRIRSVFVCLSVLALTACGGDEANLNAGQLESHVVPVQNPKDADQNTSTGDTSSTDSGQNTSTGGTSSTGTGQSTNEAEGDTTNTHQNPALSSGHIIINLSGWDDKAGDLAFIVGTGGSSRTWSTEDKGIKNGKNVGLRVLRGQRYKFHSYVRFGEPQTCVSETQLSDKGFKTSRGGDVIVDMVCTTAVSLSGSASGVTPLEFKDDAQYRVYNTPLKTNSGESILTDKLSYASSAPDVATVDESGVIHVHKVGDFSVRVRAKEPFYRSDDEVVYHYTVQKNKLGVFIEDIHIGQSSILSTQSPYHRLVANKETLVRAMIYANTDTRSAPRTHVRLVRKDKQIFTKEMICPTWLKKGGFEADSYDLADTCYAIMKTPEELTFIEPGVRVEVEVAENNQQVRKVINPMIAPNTVLNVYLVRGEIHRKYAKIIAKATPEQIEVMRAFLLDAFPVSEVNIRLREHPYVMDENLIGALEQMQAIQDTEAKPGEFAYGLVPGNQGLAAGLSRVSRGPSVGRSRANSNLETIMRAHVRIMAHELGHAFGLYHAPCGIGGNVGQVYDSFWKQNPEAWRYANKGGLSPSPMYINQTHTLKNPALSDSSDKYIHHPTDLMGYCGGYRLSKHNYQYVSKLMEQHAYFRQSGASSTPSVATRARSARVQKWVRLMGEIKDDRITLDPIQIISSPNQTLGAIDIDYAVEVTTANSHNKYPLYLFELDHLDGVRFEQVLPIDEDIKQLRFSYQHNAMDYEVKGLSKAEQSTALNPTPANIRYNHRAIEWPVSFKWMRAVWVNSQGEKTLIADKATGGRYELPSWVESGVLQVSVSNGINTSVQSFVVN